MSGSDCGHVFIWSAQNGRLVKLLKADRVGAVNCLTPHPYLPMLATSGLENSAKLWSPDGEYLPLVKNSRELRTAECVIARNLRSRERDREFARRDGVQKYLGYIYKRCADKFSVISSK